MLVIEDDRELASILGFMLSNEGHDVAIANDSIRARQLVAGVDVVLVDYHLPGTNGIDLAERLRRETGRPDLPCILATGEVSPEVISMSSHNHWWSVTKPFTASDLRAVVQRALSATTKGESNEVQ